MFERIRKYHIIYIYISLTCGPRSSRLRSLAGSISAIQFCSWKVKRKAQGGSVLGFRECYRGLVPTLCLLMFSCTLETVMGNYGNIFVWSTTTIAIIGFCFNSYGSALRWQPRTIYDRTSLNSECTIRTWGSFKRGTEVEWKEIVSQETYSSVTNIVLPLFH